MRKLVWACAIALGLYLGIWGNLAMGSTYAQCGCTCGISCGNACQASCYGCSLWEAFSMTDQCCEAAHKATGDTGPCPVEDASAAMTNTNGDASMERSW